MLALLLLLTQAAHADPEDSWRSDETTHFTIRHENRDSALGDSTLIERIYTALHPDLWQLVPWMAQKKVTVYLYSNQESYLKGRFHPPPWSGGLMTQTEDEKILAIYAPMDKAIVAHELTHLYFHSFFDDKSAQPPSWLDEGLAGILQDEPLTRPDPRDKGPVLPAPIPFNVFLRSRPAEDTPNSWVNQWYLQAHSVVRFIKRGHVDSLFTVFCQKIREGANPETALREVYGYENESAFEQAWRTWRPKKAVGMYQGPEDR